MNPNHAYYHNGDRLIDLGPNPNLRWLYVLAFIAVFVSSVIGERM